MLDGLSESVSNLTKKIIFKQEIKSIKNLINKINKKLSEIENKKVDE
jgi:hypothetical protein